MASIKEIVTRFSIKGVDAAQNGLRRIGDTATSIGARLRQAFSIKNIGRLMSDGTVGALKLSAASAKISFTAGIESAKKLAEVVVSLTTKIAKIPLAIAKVSFNGIIGGAQKLASISFAGLTLGLKTAVISGAAYMTLYASKLLAVAKAARTAADETSAMMDTISKDSRRTGISERDLSVLRYAAEREGIDPNQIQPAFSHAIGQFSMVNKSITTADQKFKQQALWNNRAALVAYQGGDDEAARAYLDDTVQKRMSSLFGVQARMAAIEKQVRQTNTGGAYWNLPSMQGKDAQEREAILAQTRRSLVDEYRQLAEAQEQIKQSTGPVGQALFELQDHGLNLDKTLKGGIDSIYELADAFKRVEDPAKRLELSAYIFGDDQGARFLTLLENGREGLDAYAKELEKTGAVVSKQQADMAAAYEDSKTNLKFAWQGVKNDITTGLDPILTETNKKVTDFLTRNKDVIAKYVEDAFKSVNLMFTDTLKLLDGDHNFDSWLFKKGQAIYDVATKYVEMIKILAMVSWRQIRLILDGQPTDFDWLNKAVLQAKETFYAIEKFAFDAFGAIKTFASDAYAVLTGGNAKTYDSLNKVRDGVLAFWSSLKKAWDMFYSLVSGIHDAIAPVLKFFGTDILTASLFLGMLRFSGLLKLMTGTVGILIGGFGTLFGAVGKSGAAVGALEGAFGGVLKSGLALISRVAVPLAALVGGLGIGAKIGEWAAQPTVDRYNAQQDQIAAFMKETGDAYMQEQMPHTYWDYRGIHAGGALTQREEYQQRQQDIEHISSSGMVVGGDMSTMDNDLLHNIATAWGREPTTTINLGVGIDTVKAIVKNSGLDVIKKAEQIYRATGGGYE